MGRVVGIAVAGCIALGCATGAQAATWSIVPVATAPAGAQSSELSAVSCFSLSSCTAVGDYVDTQGGTRMFADHWDGSTFSVQAIPSPPDVSEGGLTSISCPAANACMVVGTIQTGAETSQAYSEGWN